MCWLIQLPLLLLLIVGSYAFESNNKLKHHDFYSTATTNIKMQKTTTTKLLAMKEATFGMGCFWKPSEELLKINGVQDTIVAYTGNPSSKKNDQPPSYDSVSYGRNWVEAVRVKYDDSIVSYNELLNAFFEAQEPKMGSRQYASIIFVHNEEQESIADNWLSSEERVRNKDGLLSRITTIEPLSTVWKAEGYHQQYWQKFRPRVIWFVVLISIASGAIDSFIVDGSIDLINVHTIANGIALAGCVFVILERFFDRKVVKL